jgi:hypothetical protein
MGRDVTAAARYVLLVAVAVFAGGAIRAAVKNGAAT